MAMLAVLRASFQERLKEADPEFHPLDLDRMKDDKYLTRVLKHVDYDIVKATDILFEIFSWRLVVDANEINEDNIRLDYIKEGIIFPHGRDIDGCLLLIMKCNKHSKGAKDFRDVTRCIIYWFDRIEREENGNKITLLFDLENCGIRNMDMDLINYLILLVKVYYPYFLNYILIYQMPWVMNAAFKFVKVMLSGRGIDKLKFVNRESLRDYVSADQALSCWGGLDNYVFEFIPEVKQDAASKNVTLAERNNQHSPGELLYVSPNETIYFNKEGDDISGQFTILNMIDSVVSYKIRTTAPNKFRVRPSSGTLTTSKSQTIVITVKPGINAHTTAKDRFLVMAVQVPKVGMTHKELAKIWQDNSDNKVDEHRLKCFFPEPGTLRNLDLEEDNQKIAELLHTVKKKQDKLYSNMFYIRLMQYVMFGVIGLSIITTILLCMGLQSLLFSVHECGLIGEYLELPSA